MRILIVGGTKFIGPHVARRLVALGIDVTLYHRGVTEAPLPDSVRHVRSPAAAMPVLAFPGEVLDPAPDVVVHMIAMGEADAEAAVRAFRGRAGRLVALSSGDVYRAYGRFTGVEPGPIEPGPLAEDAPLRGVLHPYRAVSRPGSIEYDYEKILVERAVIGCGDLPGTVLRLPKVYGPGGNSDLATVYAYRRHPHRRWTHGYVENVAAAVVLAAVHPAGAGRVYNVGELHTPSVAERLDDLPPSTVAPAEDGAYDFGQDLDFDAGRIRAELGYAEPVPYREGIARTLGR